MKVRSGDHLHYSTASHLPLSQSLGLLEEMVKGYECMDWRRSRPDSYCALWPGMADLFSGGLSSRRSHWSRKRLDQAFRR